METMFNILEFVSKILSANSEHNFVNSVAQGIGSGSVGF